MELQPAAGLLSIITVTYNMSIVLKSVKMTCYAFCYFWTNAISLLFMLS